MYTTVHVFSHHFAIISSLERGVTHHDHLSKLVFGWNGPDASEEQSIFFHCRYYLSPRRWPWPFVLKNLNSLQPSTLVQSSSGPMVLERFLNVVNSLSPLGKRHAPSHAWSNLNPLYPRMLYAKFDWKCNRQSGSNQRRWWVNKSDGELMNFINILRVSILHVNV